MEENQKIALTDLISSEMLQQIQDAFSELTGFAALTTERDGTPVTKGSNFTDFCMKYTRSTEKGFFRCNKCDAEGALTTKERGRSCAYNCHAGLMDFAAPIIANGEVVGSFIGGQVLTEEPDLEKFAAVAVDLGIDPDEYIEAVRKVPVVSKENVEKASHFLYTVANIISIVAFNAYQLMQNNIELERAVRAKSDFLANMSHEIRTPMNAVLGMAEMALREEMTPAAKQHIHQIKASGKNLLVIINDILDFSKIESGKMDIVPVAYDVLSMVNDVSNIIRSRLGDKDVEFILDIAPDIPARMLGDNVRIQQIMINLLNNAVKFTKRGQVKLSLSAERVDSKIVMLRGKVEDTGCGIKEEDMPKLFGSFQQLDSKRNRNIEGTGLGLTISRRLVELMGGKISVESVYEKGTTFSFEVTQKIVDNVPLVPSDLRLEGRIGLIISNEYIKTQITKDLELVGAVTEDMTNSTSFVENDEIIVDYLIMEREYYNEHINELFNSPECRSKCIVLEKYDAPNEIVCNNAVVIHKPVFIMNLYGALGLISNDNNLDSDEVTFKFEAPDARVLIVDDNPVNLTVAQGLIEPLKMTVDTADSALAALELAKQNIYDLIFMDHMMPEIDGVEATHMIRKSVAGYQKTPIIALTANVLDGTKDMFLKEGMNDFVGKPIDVKLITSKIRKWLPLEKIVPIDASDVEAAPDDELNIEGLNVANAMKMLGSRTLYITVLKDYFLAIDKKAESIRGHYEREEWREYTIEVHALKSTSRQIGADDLAVIAYELEMAGNNNDLEQIHRKTNTMLDMYLGLKPILEPLFPDCATVKKEPYSTRITADLLDEMMEAIESFDTLAIDDVVEKMSIYDYSDGFEDQFSALQKAAEESDLDKIAEIVKLWRRAIVDMYIN